MRFLVLKRGVVFEIGIEVLSDEIEERGQLGVQGSFSCLFGSLIDLGEERQDFLCG